MISIIFQSFVKCSQLRITSSKFCKHCGHQNANIFVVSMCIARASLIRKDKTGVVRRRIKYLNKPTNLIGILLINFHVCSKINDDTMLARSTCRHYMHDCLICGCLSYPDNIDYLAYFEHVPKALWVLKRSRSYM